MTFTKKIPYVVLMLFLTCSDAAAVTVYLEDASEIEAQSAWRDGERVYVQVNPDLRLDFPLSEVDLRRTRIPDDRQARTEASEGVPAPARSGDPLDELVELAGMRRDFTYMFQQGGDSEIERIINDAVTPQLAEETVKAHLARKLTGNEVAQVLSWHRGPVGTRVMEAEALLDFNSMQKARAYVTLVDKPGFKERMNLIGQIEKATGASEVEARMVGNMLRRMLNAIPPKHPDAALIRERLRERVPSVAALRSDNRARWAYTFRELSLGELQDYLKFLRSPPGKKYTVATFDAAEEIFRKIAAGVEKSMHDELLTQMKQQ